MVSVVVFSGSLASQDTRCWDQTHGYDYSGRRHLHALVFTPETASPVIAKIYFETTAICLGLQHSSKSKKSLFVSLNRPQLPYEAHRNDKLHRPLVQTMPMPPAAQEATAESINEANRIGTSSATKRSREDDLGMASSSGSHVGGQKKRKNCGDMIAINPLSKLEQNTTKDGVGTVDDDIDKNSEKSYSEGEIDDFESPEWEQGDILELDRKDIREQLSSGLSILVLQTTSNWRSHCRARFCIPQMLRGRPNIECDFRFNLMDRTGQRRSEMAWYSRGYRPP